MKALLLAAGIGSRLRPLTYHTPKCLVDVNGIPLLEYWLGILSSLGVDEIFINTHHLPELVEDFLVQSKYKKRVKLLYEENLLGTGGTIKKHNDRFKMDDTLVIHADNLCITNFSDFKNFHRNFGNKNISIMTFYTPQPENCGIVSVNQYQQVVSFDEKQSNNLGNLANGAVYCISGEVMDKISEFEADVFDFTKDFLANNLEGVFAWHNNYYHLDVGTMAAQVKIKEDASLIQVLASQFNIFPK